MFLRKGDYVLAKLEQKNLEETVNLVATQFVKNNPVWKAYNISFELAQKFIRSKIIPEVPQSISFVLLNKDNKVVGCVITIDLRRYQQKKSEQKDLMDNTIDSIKEIENMDMFKKLASVDNQILSEIMKNEIPYGSTYNYYGVIDDQIVNGGLASWMFYATFYIARVGGVKHFYARLTNPIAFKILRKMGAIEVNRFTFNEPEIGLNNYPIYLVYFCLDNLQIFKEHL